MLVIKEKGIFFFKVEFILFSRFSIADRLSREHFGLGSSKNQLCHEKGFGPLPKTDDFRKDQSTKKVEFLYRPTTLQWAENILKVTSTCWSTSNYARYLYCKFCRKKACSKVTTLSHLHKHGVKIKGCISLKTLARYLIQIHAPHCCATLWIP